MAKKMLVDASHPEETRVVVLDGNRVEEFDYESASRRPLKGNIYLAKVTRVEPSLQACFIEYGGNRHGFLAFSEIHPDYYQIPTADRQALLAANRAEQRHEDDRRRAAASRQSQTAAYAHAERSEARAITHSQGDVSSSPSEPTAPATAATKKAASSKSQPAAKTTFGFTIRKPMTDAAPKSKDTAAPRRAASTPSPTRIRRARNHARLRRRPKQPRPSRQQHAAPESAGGDDAMEELPRRDHRSFRRYKIQEVIKRRQVLAGSGRQGRARQQGRGADDLYVAGRPLLRADAEHRSRRRHFAQNFERGRPPQTEGSRGRA